MESDRCKGSARTKGRKAELETLDLRFVAIDSLRR